MRNFILLLCAVTAVKHIKGVPLGDSTHYHSEEFKRSSVCIGEKAGSYAHPTICSKYVVCDGKDGGVIKSCGPKTNYDPDYKICVWEDIYSCKGKNFCKGKQDGDYPDASTCISFIKCVGGLTYRTDCPKGLWYNEKLNLCDYPKNLNCQVTTAKPSTTTATTTTSTATTSTRTTTTPTTTTTSTTTTTTPTTTTTSTRTTTTTTATPTTVQPTTTTPTTTKTKATQVPSVSCVGKKDGNYADPSRCGGYITCVANKVHKMNCPHGLWYNEKMDRCDWPRNVNCKPKTTRTTTTTRTTKVSPTSYLCNNKVGNVAHPNSCTSFIVCSAGGKAVVRHCPKGLHYQPKLGVCVWNYNYPCINGTAVAHTCIGKPDGNYEDPIQCGGYIACVAGLRYPMKCPSGLWYNKKTDKCDYPNNVDCKNGNKSQIVTSQPMPSVKPTVPDDFCKSRSNGNYADPTKCSGYIICNNGFANRMNCPSKLWYDVKTNTCNYQKDTDCKISSKSAFSCKGKNAGGYESKDKCNEFYVCDGVTDNSELKTCPKHTNFYPSHRVCVWSYSYSCTDPNFCVGKKDGKYKNIYNCYGYYECSAGRTFPDNCEPGMRFNGMACVDATKYTCV